MCSSEEILSSLNDLPHLSKILKENPDLILSDSIYLSLANHFLSQPITIEVISVLRNVYGRKRSSTLNQIEIDLFLLIIKECFNSDDKQLIKIFLQYLHNINRLLPNEYEHLSYLCSIICLKNGDKNVIACILSAYIQMKISNSIRYDLIINYFYENENDEDEDNPWIDQLTKLIIENDKQWLRKYYLERIYNQQFLNTIDQHDLDNLFNIQPIKQQTDQISTSNIHKIDLSEISTLNDLYLKLDCYVTNSIPIESINELSLYNLFYSLTTYPYDIHILFSCLSINLLNRTNYDKTSYLFFRRLINLLNNYYITQQDLFDDNGYRLMIVTILSKFLCEIHRRRSNDEHEWYHLYLDVPQRHPLPTFDLISDLICLLGTLTYQNVDCQNQVRLLNGTIESILSMTIIDINQPKAQASVTWLIKCLTEFNQENRDYIKQIK